MKFHLLSITLLLVIASSCQQTNTKIRISKRTYDLTNKADSLRLHFSKNKDTLAKALKMLDTAIKIDSGYEKSYADKVFILCSFKNYPGALLALNKAVSLSKNDPRLVVLQGILLEKTGQITIAMTKYKQADGLYDDLIKANPTAVNLKLNKAFLQLLLNNKNEAIKEYDDIAKDSKDPTVVNMKPLFYVFNRDAYVNSILQNIN